MKSFLEKVGKDISSEGEVTDERLCDLLDSDDQLSKFRQCFLIPPAKSSPGNDSIYLCGNSLGLQPTKLREHVEFQLNKWAQEGVEGHFNEPLKWLTIDDSVQSSSARLVGALPHEVVIMNSLTCNLHLMMTTFYRPTSTRYKIIIEKKAFPSDFQAVESQILLHGLNPNNALIEVSPRDGEILLRIEDIEEVLLKEGPSTALVLFSGVQYFTGQFFDLGRITATARTQGCCVGFDLAHAVGNVPLSLHDWGCDFACWCSYKYLNSGPGGIAGCFVHERHAGQMITSSNTTTNDDDDNVSVAMLPRLAGWWGHRLEDRFDMAPVFRPCYGAYGFRLSNPPVLMVSCLRASLDLFDEAGMDRLRAKSIALTAYLEALLQEELPTEVLILSPKDPAQRGCQLSLSFRRGNVESIHNELEKNGIICDVRKPDVMRIAPTPLYNSFRDVFEFVKILKKTVLLLPLNLSESESESLS